MCRMYGAGIYMACCCMVVCASNCRKKLITGLSNIFASYLAACVGRGYLLRQAYSHIEAVQTRGLNMFLCCCPHGMSNSLQQKTVVVQAFEVVLRFSQF